MLLMPALTGITGDWGPWKKHERPFKPPHVASQKVLDSGRVKARRRILKEFFRWYVSNRHRFAFKLQLEQRVDEWVEFSFIGLNPAITATFVARSGEIEVRIKHDWQGGSYQSWDIIGNSWAWPEKVAGRRGYIDVSLLEKYRKLRPSRLAIWTHGIFEDFLVWVNEKLANAYGIELRGERDMWSDGKLILHSEIEAYRAEHGEGASTDIDGSYRQLVPCRVPCP